METRQKRYYLQIFLFPIFLVGGGYMIEAGYNGAGASTLAIGVCVYVAWLITQRDEQ